VYQVQVASFMEIGLLPVRRLTVFDSHVGFLEELFCVAGVNYFEIFSRGVSPAEADPGELCVSGRRVELSTIFLIAD